MVDFVTNKCKNYVYLQKFYFFGVKLTESSDNV